MAPKIKEKNDPERIFPLFKKMVSRVTFLFLPKLPNLGDRIGKSCKLLFTLKWIKIALSDAYEEEGEDAVKYYLCLNLQIRKLLKLWPT